MLVLHVKVKDDAIGEHVGKVSHEAEGCEVIQGTEIGKKRQRNKQCKQIHSSNGRRGEGCVCTCIV